MVSIADAVKESVAALKGIRMTLDVVYQETLIDIGTSLVFYTPLDTGLASSNWNVGMSTATGEDRKPEGGDKGAASISAIKSQAKRIGAGERAVFSNTVDYIDDLEKGTSPQAPAGMVRPTLVRIDGFWRKNLKKHNLIK